MRITHTEYHVEIFLKRRTRESARKYSHQLTQRIEDSIYDAIFQAARKKIQEHIRAGRLAKGFGVRMVS
jgi:predicted HicB family RNase H-like nuclease